LKSAHARIVVTPHAYIVSSPAPPEWNGRFALFRVTEQDLSLSLALHHCRNPRPRISTALHWQAPLTWHAQLNCQRAIVPIVSQVPKIGGVSAGHFAPAKDLALPLPPPGQLCEEFTLQSNLEV